MGDPRPGPAEASPRHQPPDAHSLGIPVQLSCIRNKPHREWRRSGTGSISFDSRGTETGWPIRAPGTFGPAPSQSLRCSASQSTGQLPPRRPTPSVAGRGLATFRLGTFLREEHPPHICLWGPEAPGLTVVPLFWPPQKGPHTPPLPPSAFPLPVPIPTWPQFPLPHLTSAHYNP